MFKTHYEGELSMIGSGVYTSNWMARRSIIKIGGTSIRNVMLSDLIDSFLDQAVSDESGEKAQLSVGWCMFFRWALAIKHKGETVREGFFIFLAGMLTHLIVASIAALIFGGIMSSWIGGFGTFLGFIAGLAVVVTLLLNVKAWLVPGFD